MARIVLIILFIQLTAVGTDKHVVGMTGILRQDVTGKKVKGTSTYGAGLCLNPDEVLNISLFLTALPALGLIKTAHLALQPLQQP